MTSTTTELPNFWYVVARSGELKKRPIARRLHGRSLVVFRDGNGVARVLDGLCPHRGAALARGRVVGNCIECPYHGWQFDGAGNCQLVPAGNLKQRIPPQFHTASFPVVEQQGLIWTTLGTPVTPVPPRFDVLDDPKLATVCYVSTQPVTFDWWIDNTLDFAHIPYVHPKTIGERNDALGEFTIERHRDDLGFTGRAETRRSYDLLARLLRLDMVVTVTVRMASSVLFDFEVANGSRQWVLALASPEDDRHTRVWNFSIRNYLRHIPGSDLIGWWLMRKVVEEDVGFGRKACPQGPTIESWRASTRADEMGLEWLRLARLWRAKQPLQPTERQSVGHRGPTE